MAPLLLFNLHFIQLLDRYIVFCYCHIFSTYILSLVAICLLTYWQITPTVADNMAVTATCCEEQSQGSSRRISSFAWQPPC